MSKAKKQTIRKISRKNRSAAVEQSVELLTKSANRANTLAEEAWKRQGELSSIMIGAALREIMIDMKVVCGAADNLAAELNRSRA